MQTCKVEVVGSVYTYAHTNIYIFITHIFHTILDTRKTIQTTTQHIHAFPSPHPPAKGGYNTTIETPEIFAACSPYLSECAWP